MALHASENRPAETRVRKSGAPDEHANGASTYLTLAEVRQLIALMNSTDLTEIAIEGPGQERLLVLRSEIAMPGGESAVVATAPALAEAAPSPVKPAPADVTAPHEYVTAPLVGVYYPAMKPGGKPLVAVGERINDGQLVAGIESLHVMNEVMSAVTGRVVEVLVKPGQPVEYGQRLMAIAPEATR